MKQKIEPLWVRQAQAHKLFGVSRSFFLNHIKQHLEPIILSSRCIVYEYNDLVAFCDEYVSTQMKGGKQCIPVRSDSHGEKVVPIGRSSGFTKDKEEG